MSQRGPILVVSTAERRPSLAAPLDGAKLFPILESDWSDAARAIEQMRPAAVIAATAGADPAAVGALAEATAPRQPLNARDIDGIVLAEGFSARVMDAFLTVLTEDARFRNLPVIVASDGLAPSYDLANLEIVAGDAARVVATILPLVRQHAFDLHLTRTLRAIDAEGLIDARTGLLTNAAFDRDLATAVYQTMERGGGLSLARFAFDPEHPRARFDGARIISRLMRKMDFGAVLDDGSVVVVFAETELKNAHAIARRLLSVMRHTSHGKRDRRAEPDVSVTTLLPKDTAKSLLARLYHDAHRAAS